MALDVSAFHKLVVTDTCSVWNVLSSRMLHRTSVAAGCVFSLTGFTLYECLHKPRQQEGGAADIELQRRLTAARKDGQFQSFSLDVADLQDIEILERRQRLSKGELASIAFAKKTRQAFLTDDQQARVLAATAIEHRLVQTTPQLLGWLVFIGRLGDTDVSDVIEEHERLRRPLRSHFLNMHREALRCRLMIGTR
jgi:hypothetical protein